MRFLKCALVAVFSLCALVHAETPAITDYRRTITVSGTGDSFVVPDLAYITLGMSQRDRSARLAMEAVNAQIAKIIKLSSKFRIEAKDIQTSNLALGQDYSDEKPHGFLANATLVITFKKLDVIGDFIGEAVAEGANTIQSIQFASSTLVQAAIEARAKAFKDAESRAKQYAELAGRPLGEVLTVEESSPASTVPFQQPMYRMAALESSPATIAAGQLKISISVTTKYAL